MAVRYAAGHYLLHCKNLAIEADCDGAPAERFCEMNGFGGALNYTIVNIAEGELVDITAPDPPLAATVKNFGYSQITCGEHG